MRLLSYQGDIVSLPFQIALDIGYQISGDLYQKLKKATFTQSFHFKTANDWINLEAFGNTAASRAYDLSLILAEYFLIFRE